MMSRRVIVLFLCCVVLAYCGKGGGEDSSTEAKPALNLSFESSTATSATFEVKTINATYIRVLCLATDDKSAQTAQDVAEKGTKYTGTTFVIDGLSALTAYTVFAVACDDAGRYGELQTLQFATDELAPTMYAWEQARNGILSFSDMVLCYGGSSHRDPYLWTQNRFAPYVSYVDQQGKEHWLFDGFLCLEFQYGYQYAFEVGHPRYRSARKEEWQGLINYWFNADNNGVNALEKAVKEASTRLGAPPTKRKVIISIPEPVIYQYYDQTNESTTYWGMLSGRTLDFAIGKDRVSACKWYINEVRKRFNEANYQYVELAGFYVISEEIVLSPAVEDGWAYILKKSDEVVPPVSKYLHALNECLCWIPYNRAGGYKKWSQVGVDYAYMQPNHFWDDKNERPLSRFFSDILSNNLAMEFEFDEALLEGRPNCEVYKQRFRNYMSNAKAYGIYGKKPLSYYHGTDGFYLLSASPVPKDRELYHEFCQFVINNPLRLQ